MNVERDILDPSWMCLEGTFEEQVLKLFHHVRLSKGQVEADLLRLFSDVKDTLGTIWPGCGLTPYGSLYQGTGFKTSDVDCCIELPTQYKTTEEKLVYTARDALSRRPNIFTQLSAKINASVPIVKFFHLPTSRKCDLTFNCPPGVTCNQLVWYLLHLDERALDLTVLVKYWAKIHNFTGPYLLRTYTLILMVIFYLQQLKMLPTVQTLQRNAPVVPWRIWNVAFNESTYSSNNKLPLKQLLGGFLMFFSEFEFEKYVISPFVGRAIERESFKRVSDVPNDFQLYKDNVTGRSCEPLQLDTPICVQDVFEHSANCSESVSLDLAQHIRECFKSAAKLYTSELDENFLKAILAVRSRPPSDETVCEPIGETGPIVAVPAPYCYNTIITKYAVGT